MSLRLLPVRSKPSAGRDPDQPSTPRNRLRPSLEIFEKIPGSFASLVRCLRTPYNTSLQQPAAATGPSENKDPAPASALPSPSPCPLTDLPPEILEKILEQTILDLDPVAWDFIGRSSLSGKESFALCPAYMPVPVLAHVDKYFRSALLAHLSRTTTFRIDSQLSAEELSQGTPWLRILDSRRECGIRRLQVRLSKADSKGKKANLNLRYFTQAREWKIELVVDQGFEEEDDPADEAKPFATRSQAWKPNYFELEMLRKVLKMFTSDREGEIQGLSWEVTTLVMRIVRYWIASDGNHFRYQGFQETVALPPEPSIETVKKPWSGMPAAVMVVKALFP